MIQGRSLTVRGLNVLAEVISTPATPAMAATWVCGDKANSARGAVSLATEAISTARQAEWAPTAQLAM